MCCASQIFCKVLAQIAFNTIVFESLRRLLQKPVFSRLVSSAGDLRTIALRSLLQESQNALPVLLLLLRSVTLLRAVSAVAGAQVLSMPLLEPQTAPVILLCGRHRTLL